MVDFAAETDLTVITIPELDLMTAVRRKRTKPSKAQYLHKEFMDQIQTFHVTSGH